MWYVVLVFCFFAAVIPESIATWSTSVAKVVGHPADLLFVILFYGLADLLVREAMVRRHLGWVSLILFGIAFGFLNEGVVAGTWYTVAYGGYIYIGQVNYAWAVALTVFHTFISVIIPLAFIETLFPSRAGLPLLRRRGIVISATVFLLLTSVFLFVPSYRPYRIAVFALALTLALIALRLPAARPRILSATPPPGFWRLRWTGFFASVTYFVLILIVPPITLKLAGPYALAAQYVDIVLFILFSAFTLAIGRGWTARAGWSPRHTLALMTGVLMFSILITLLPPVWSTLEPLATLPFLLLLILLNIRLRRRDRTRTMTAATSDTGAETPAIASV
jgi:hypothetical protein